MIHRGAKVILQIWSLDNYQSISAEKQVTILSNCYITGRKSSLPLNGEGNLTYIEERRSLFENLSRLSKQNKYNQKQGKECSKLCRILKNRTKLSNWNRLEMNAFLKPIPSTALALITLRKFTWSCT